MSRLLRNKIANRPVAIMAHGKSIKELEQHIKDLPSDICWTSLGVFTIMDDLLKMANKELEIIFDCATVAERRMDYYEDKIRFPRILNFLHNSTKRLWITSKGMIEDSVKKYRPKLLESGFNQIVVIDSLVSKKRIPKLMDVPNSITLMIGVMLAGGASKIILFGFDGYVGPDNCPPESCYKPEEIKAERLAAIGSESDPGINRDTGGFERRFPNILSNYRIWFGNNAPIYNCSSSTSYTVIKKIQYKDLKKIL